jgi:hypothetical protein
MTLYNLTFAAQDFTTDPTILVGKYVTLYPLNAPDSGTFITTIDKKRMAFSASGVVVFNDVIGPAYYKFIINGPYVNTTGSLFVSSSQTDVNATDCRVGTPTGSLALYYTAQVCDSRFIQGTGGMAFSSSTAISSSHAVEANHATSADTASYFNGSVTSASYATTASYVLDIEPATASYANVAGVANSINFVPNTASYSTIAGTANALSFIPASASFATTASYSLVTQVTQSSTTSSISSSFATTASYASTSPIPNLVPSASWVSAATQITTAATASYVSSANVVGTITSASFSTTASYSPPPIQTLYFTKSLTSYLHCVDLGIFNQTSWLKSHACRVTMTTFDRQVSTFGFANSCIWDVNIIAPGLNSDTSFVADTWYIIPPTSATKSTYVPQPQLEVMLEFVDGGEYQAKLRLVNHKIYDYDPSIDYQFTIENTGPADDKFVMATSVPYDTAAAVDYYPNYNLLWIQTGSFVNIAKTTDSVGIGTLKPAAKLQVVGNVIGDSFTGSLQGTSSFALSASHALYADNAGTQLVTASTYPITASFAVSASWAPATSIPDTASYSNTASWAINVVNGGATLVTASTYPITASFAVTASYVLTDVEPATSSYALVAGTANALSFIPDLANTASYTAYKVSNSVTADTASYVSSTNVVGTVNSASWALTASYVVDVEPATSSYAITSSAATSLTFIPVSASYALSSSHSDFAGQAKVADSINFTPESASFAGTASYLIRDRTYQVTASAAVSASHSNVADTASYVLSITSASWAASTPSADFALLAGNAITATTASYFAQDFSHSLYFPISSSLMFNTTSIYSQSGLEGRIFWDAEDHTLAICQSPNVTNQVGQEIVQRVLASENITNGQVLYYTGTSSLDPVTLTYRSIVGLAIADGTGVKSTIAGMATENFTSGSKGFMTVIGDVHDINTSALTEGQPAYLSTTVPGGLVATRPNPPYEQTYVGIVNRKDATLGTITVNIANPPFTSFISNAGLTSQPTFTASGSGASFWVNVTTASCNLYNNDSGSDTIKNYFLPAKALAMAATGSSYFIYADYNGGTPIYNITTDRTLTNGITKVIVGTVVRPIYNPSGIEIITHDLFGYALTNKLNTRLIRTNRFGYESGFGLSESGSNKAFIVNSGVAWFGGDRMTTNTVNSATSPCRFFQTVPTGSSSTGWSSSVVLGYNNTQYDNGAGSLVTFGGGAAHWAINYIFKSLADGDNDVYYVLGRADYTTLAAAAASTIPSNLPAILDQSQGLSILVGRILAQKNVVPASQIDSAFNTNFGVSAISTHNNLSGLQGGTSNEYYHLTSAEYTTLQSNTASYALTSSFLTRDRTYQVTSSWAVSASWAPAGSVTSASFATTASAATSITFAPATASFSTTASYANTASAATSITFTPATSSYALTTNTIFGSITASSYGITTSSISPVISASLTMSNAMCGIFNVISGSSSITVALATSSIDNAFQASFYQSATGSIVFTNAGGATLRNRSSLSSSAGQYAIVSLIRVNTTDFVLAGDTA